MAFLHAKRLEDKVALITGGASGIGKATAKLFAQHGARLVIADILDKAGSAVCEELNTQTKATYVHCDVTNETDVEKVVDAAVDRYGKLDIMFNHGSKNRPIPIQIGRIGSESAEGDPIFMDLERIRIKSLKKAINDVLEWRRRCGELNLRWYGRGKCVGTPGEAPRSSGDQLSDSDSDSDFQNHVFNNAGVIGSPVIPILQSDKSNFQKVMSVNVTGCYLGTKHASRVMIPARRGSIISTASVASVEPGITPVAYTCSKHAVLGIMRSAAAELGPYSIRVNCVSPNVLPTPLAAEALQMEERELQQAMEDKAVLKGVGLTKDDVAYAALYLGSDESKYVSGLNLLIDGAFSVTNPSFGVF
ncbi:hypothetical protein LUZ63_002951 [Rhynchospora breviuscula]|uniref:Uncharacterized protein n=1 Tax=Rhynchospora breviuscula TaxID=2022672 RepID=A0A9Q0CZP8_9POAL|nr:hypothetical protein LUZ63_002951 [Rhynchospora breviuscula]